MSLGLQGAGLHLRSRKLWFPRRLVMWERDIGWPHSEDSLQREGFCDGNLALDWVSGGWVGEAALILFSSDRRWRFQAKASCPHFLWYKDRKWACIFLCIPSPLHVFLGRPACSLDRKKPLGHGCQRWQCLQGPPAQTLGAWPGLNNTGSSLTWHSEPQFPPLMPHWGGEDFLPGPVIT